MSSPPAVGAEVELEGWRIVLEPARDTGGEPSAREHRSNRDGFRLANAIQHELAVGKEKRWRPRWAVVAITLSLLLHLALVFFMFSTPPDPLSCYLDTWPWTWRCPETVETD